LVVARPTNPVPKEATVQLKTPVVVAGITNNHAESLVTPVVAGTQLNHAESLVTPVVVAGGRIVTNHAESLVG
jgi:hypothetical protein